MNRRGITLIELLVAMFVAALVAYLAFDLIRGEQSHYSRVRTKVRLQDDAREAIRIIEEDLMNTGYRAGLNLGSKFLRDSVLFSCDTIKDSNRVVVRDGGASNSDTLEVRFYEASATSGVNCQISPNIVRYYVAGGMLERAFTKAGTTTPTVSAVLANVATLQLQVGVDSSSAPTTTIPAADTPWVHAEKLAWTASGATATSPYTVVSSIPADSQRVFTGFARNAVFALNTTAPRALLKNSTYRASLLLVANPGFLAMFDTSSTSTSYMRLIVSTVPGGGGTVIDSTTVRAPVVNSPTWVSWQFQTTSAQSVVYLSLKGMLSLAQGTTAPTLGLASVNVSRVRNGGQAASGAGVYTWLDNDTAIATRKQTRAVRVWLLAKSAKANKDAPLTFTGIGNFAGFTTSDLKSYSVYERVIPVGN